MLLKWWRTSKLVSKENQLRNSIPTTVSHILILRVKLKPSQIVSKILRAKPLKIKQSLKMSSASLLHTKTLLIQILKLPQISKLLRLGVNCKINIPRGRVVTYIQQGPSASMLLLPEVTERAPSISSQTWQVARLKNRN